jgi:hypothetical protein
METVKTIMSRDGRYSLDIQRDEAGLYRFVTFSDRYRTDTDFQNPPYWTIEDFSGLYDTAEAAEADARSQFVWLCE